MQMSTHVFKPISGSAQHFAPGFAGALRPGLGFHAHRRLDAGGPVPIIPPQTFFKFFAQNQSVRLDSQKLRALLAADCLAQLDIPGLAQVSAASNPSLKLLNKTLKAEVDLSNLPLAFRRKKRLRVLKLDAAYLSLSRVGLANLQKALNRTPQLESFSLLLYKNKLISDDLETFFDGLRGMEKLVTLNLNIAG